MKWDLLDSDCKKEFIIRKNSLYISEVYNYPSLNLGGYHPGKIL